MGYPHTGLEFHQKYSAARRIYNSVLGGYLDETLF